MHQLPPLLKEEWGVQSWVLPSEGPAGGGLCTGGCPRDEVDLASSENCCCCLSCCQALGADPVMRWTAGFWANSTPERVGRGEGSVSRWGEQRWVQGFSPSPSHAAWTLGEAPGGEVRLLPTLPCQQVRLSC